MAETNTTLSSAVAVGDTVINVGSATGFAIGNLIVIDGEMMAQTAAANGTLIQVRRGINGTATTAHVVTANVQTGLPSDFATGAVGIADSVTYPNYMTTVLNSYTSATAAILFGAARWTFAVLNGTTVINATLTNPTKDQDGILLTIVGNGKAAHTVTYTAGLGNAGSSYDVGTWTGNGQCSQTLIAANGIWMPLHSPQAGTLTNIAVTWA